MKAGSQAARPRFWTADFAAKLQISFGFHPCLTFVRHSSVKRNKEANMEQVNLGSVIEQAITRSSQNRLGEKPPVFVALAPVLPQIPWRCRPAPIPPSFFIRVIAHQRCQCGGRNFTASPVLAQRSYGLHRASVFLLGSATDLREGS